MARRNFKFSFSVLSGYSQMKDYVYFVIPFYQLVEQEPNKLPYFATTGGSDHLSEV